MERRDVVKCDALLMGATYMPGRSTLECAGEIVLPDLVACFWPKDGLKNFSDYARAFRQLDKENALDLPASFFLLAEEYDAAFGG